MSQNGMLASSWPVSSLEGKFPTSCTAQAIGQMRQAAAVQAYTNARHKRMHKLQHLHTACIASAAQQARGQAERCHACQQLAAMPSGGQSSRLLRS